ncbi:MAG: hypothetical protein ACE367_25410 [Acidimicrobiales bacterium]
MIMLIKTLIARVSMIIVAAAVSFACSGSPDMSEFATDSVSSSAFEGCSDDMRRLVRTWNSQTGQILGDFLDESVTADAYLSTSRRLLPQAEDTVMAMRALRQSCIDQEWAVISELLPTYEDKLSGYTALENAVRIGSPEAAQDGLEILDRANQQSLRLACELAEVTGERLPSAAASQCP